MNNLKAKKRMDILKSLKFLNFTHIEINDPLGIIRKLYFVIFKRIKKVKKVTIAPIPKIKENDTFVKIFTKLVSAMKDVKILNISRHSYLSLFDFEGILSQVCKITKLEELDISGNRIGMQTALLFKEYLLNSKTIKKINISHCEFISGTLFPISEGIRNTKRLSCFIMKIVRHQNGDEIAEFFYKLIGMNTLIHLDFEYSKFTNIYIAKQISLFLKGMLNLKKLKLNLKNLTDENSILLSGTISELKTLDELYLTFNDLTEEQYIRIMWGIAYTPSLKLVYFHNDQCTEKTIEEGGDGFRRMLLLKKLKINLEGRFPSIKSYSKLLDANTCLSNFSIEGNDPHIYGILENLTNKNKFLSKLKLQICLDDVATEKAIQGLKLLENLKELTLFSNAFLKDNFKPNDLLWKAVFQLPSIQRLKFTNVINSNFNLNEIECSNNLRSLAFKNDRLNVYIFPDTQTINNFLGNLQNISSLELSFCKLNDLGLMIISSKIKELPNLNLLNLKGNLISLNGILQLIKIINKFVNIKKVDVSGNNFLNDFDSLFKLFQFQDSKFVVNRYSSICLLKLFLKSTIFHKRSGISRLGKYLFRIQKIIGLEPIMYLYYKRYNPKFIENLDVTGINEKHDSFCQIIKLFKKFKEIKVLKASANNIKLKGAYLISQTINSFPLLKSLDLSSNKLNGKSIFILIETLLKLNSFNKLNIRSNVIENEGIDSIKKLILLSKSLDYLDCGKNSIKNKGIQEAIIAGTKSISLQILKLDLNENYNEILDKAIEYFKLSERKFECYLSCEKTYAKTKINAEKMSKYIKIVNE